MSSARVTSRALQGIRLGGGVSPAACPVHTGQAGCHPVCTG